MSCIGDFDFYYNRNLFTWYDGDELVATVAIQTEEGIKWITDLFVSPLYRRQGIGTELLQFCVLLGGKKLRVSRTNEAGKALYEKFGFCVYDESKSFLSMEFDGKEAVDGEQNK